jgi:D-aminoacyl-tRNA deacylase
MNMHILFSSRIGASANPAKILSENWFSKKGDGWAYGKHLLLDTKVGNILDVPVDFESEGLVVLSTHKSEKEYPALTVHVPGNWDAAGMGGEPRTLNTVMASGMKEVLLGLHEGNGKYSLGWNVNMEVDHHGPTCSVPIMFVEIGSSEKEWKNPTAAKIVAEAVMRMIEADSVYDSYFCVGGGHYSQKFTKLGLEDAQRAAGHILPKYQAPNLGMDTFKQAMEKSVEETQGVLIEKKGVRKEHRELIEGFAKEYGTEVKIEK